MKFVTVTATGVEISEDNIVLGVYADVEQWVGMANMSEERFLCSSSLDWPEDYTSDKDIIELADLIRGNNISGRNSDFNRI